jgi:hypothetical protein
MAATLSQMIANRLNALKSTGPRTNSGKARSCRNATTHGLSRLPSVPSGGLASAIADRKQQWRSSYRPEGTAQMWWFDRFVAESVRLDFCDQGITSLREELAEHASESWDDDRAALIASQASAIGAWPEVVQPRLLQSKHGVLWMIERWDEVAVSLRRAKGWTPASWDLAMDLLGLSKAARVGSGPWDLDPQDAGPEPGLDLARQSVEALRNRLSAFLEDRDAWARQDAQLGLGPDVEQAPDLRLLERYARDARRQVTRCLGELRRLQAEAASSGSTPAAKAGPQAAASSPPSPRPVRTPVPRPSAAPEPEPNPEPEPAAPRSNPAATPTTGPLSSMIRDRLSPTSSSPNRRARRAQFAASRRS